MNHTTDYSPSVVHTLLEMEARGSLTAAEIVQVLELEKSSVSRMLAKLVKAGELEESPSTEMHGSFYAREHHFGSFFENKVAAGLAEFSGRLDNPGNQIWLAMLNGRIVGSVAIDGEDLGNNGAPLRWFILDEGCRGSGVSRKLIAEAMKFCDERAFSAVQLYTFNKLAAARCLYESFGFELSKEWQGDQWGSTITEQQFMLQIN